MLFFVVILMCCLIFVFKWFIDIVKGIEEYMILFIDGKYIDIIVEEVWFFIKFIFFGKFKYNFWGFKF